MYDGASQRAGDAVDGLHTRNDELSELIDIACLGSDDHVIRTSDILREGYAFELTDLGGNASCLADLGLNEDVCLNHGERPFVGRLHCPTAALTGSRITSSLQLTPAKDQAKTRCRVRRAHDRRRDTSVGVSRPADRHHTSGGVISISDLGEFGLIDAIVAAVATSSPNVIVGPGDDAAVLAAPDGKVVVTTDVLVEGRHFRNDWMSAADVGHRAAAASLADIAAMGARTTGIVVGLGVPGDLEVAWVEGMAKGLAEECALGGASVVGGDVVRSQQIVISVTAMGSLDGAAPVLRSGARAGDIVALNGRVGHAAAGLAILSRGFRSGAMFIEAYRRPQPPYDAGPLAGSLGATSMCDVSDGLIQDLGHIASASQVSIDLKRASFLLPQRMVEIASALSRNPLEWVLGGGDDHALVATFPASTTLPEPWVVIGAVSAGDAVTVDGEPFQAAGWDHFAR